MDTLLLEAGKQLPAIGLMVFLVSIFLKYSREDRTDHRAQVKEMHDQCDKRNGELHEENMEARKETNQVLESNARAMIQMTTVAERMNARLDGHPGTPQGKD